MIASAITAVLAVRAPAQTVTCATAPSLCVAGGGSPDDDCVLEWRLPVAPPSGQRFSIVCYEGDPLCDADPDIGNARCRIATALCINNNDPRLSSCLASDSATFAVRKPAANHTRDAADAANLATLESVANQSLGVTVLRDGAVFLAGTPNATPDDCAAAPLDVPLRVRRSGVTRRGRKVVRVEAFDSAARRDGDVLKLECRPSTCGNGTTEPWEDCDDGNRLNGDGCDQGCRVEAPTPTPTATMLPSATATRTASITPTRTVTATRTATGTATATPTASHTATPTDTATATPTNTATPADTATPTMTATPADTATETATATPADTTTATETETPTATATPTATPNITLGITGYRPMSEFYGSPFQRRAVPQAQNLVPGIGVRINGDDDNGDNISDYGESPVVNENDLVELTLTVSTAPAQPGVEYALTRSDNGIRVWADSSKANALLDLNNDVVLTFSGTTRTVWVERLNTGDTLLTLHARPSGGGADFAAVQARLFAFTSIVIALGGENQSPSDPPDSNHGVFNIALTLYDMGYDVHEYDEDNVSGSGSGAVYTEVARAVQQRSIGIVSIFGYSHGGGSTHDLANLLNNNRAILGNFTIPYTAYIDGIRNSSDIDINSETRLPPSTAYHVNYYQRNDTFIKGNSVSGANVDVNAGNQPWGSGVVHGGIDDLPEVRSAVLNGLLAHVAP